MGDGRVQQGVVTGYFGKVVGRNSCRTTKVHAVYGDTGRPVCGTVIGSGMLWHFCSARYNADYVTCERCREWYRRWRARQR